MKSFGWKYDESLNGHYVDKKVDRETVENKALQTLLNITTGEAWTSTGGVKHIPVMFNDEPVGNLWEEANLNELKIGTYWAGQFGIKTELVKDNDVIGMLWLPQE